MKNSGFFTHYKNEVNHSLALLDTVSLTMKVKDPELPKDIVLSRSKQEIKIDDFVLPVRKAHSYNHRKTSYHSNKKGSSH